MFNNQLEIQKIEKSNELRNLGVNPYPHFLVKDMSIKEFRDKFAFIQEQEEKKASEEVSIAGLDGFSNIPTENYVTNDLINVARENEFDERNEIMSEELKKISENIKLNFITTTQYSI